MDGTYNEANSGRLYTITGGIWICMIVGLSGVLVCCVMFWNSSQGPALEVRPERINPNTAAAGSLVRLPNIGKARASDIIAYRKTMTPEETAFETVHDLENIHGIGPKTAATLEPWLTFEDK